MTEEIENGRGTKLTPGFPNQLFSNCFRCNKRFCAGESIWFTSGIEGNEPICKDCVKGKGMTVEQRDELTRLHEHCVDCKETLMIVTIRYEEAQKRFYDAINAVLESRLIQND